MARRIFVIHKLPYVPLQRSSYSWLFRYKLYHLPFWFIYHYMWWTISIGSASAAAHNIISSPYAIKYCFYVVFQAIGVYFNLYFLIPRFLEKGHYVRYMIYLLATVICTAILIVPGYYVSAWLVGKTTEDLYGIDPGNYTFFFKTNTLSSTLASTTLAMSIKLTKSWIQTKRREQELEKEKSDTELKFLKSQFNPHFLFNTINSIFVLIHKNPAMASESLAKFSDLLRYQLYECNERHIPLKRELAYIENFIELAKLRQDHTNTEVRVKLQHDQYLDLVIAPFILMPFIENAFKHVSKLKDHTNWITIDVSHDQHQLYVAVSNSVAKDQTSSREAVQYGGIGLKSVQRRLDLIYPGQYDLDIRCEDQFRVTLRLKLEILDQEKNSIPVMEEVE